MPKPPPGVADADFQTALRELEAVVGRDWLFKSDEDVALYKAKSRGGKSFAFFEPGEDHWHGAAPTRFMTHIAIVQVDEAGNGATWGDHVTDEEYGAAPALGG